MPLPAQAAPWRFTLEDLLVKLSRVQLLFLVSGCISLGAARLIQLEIHESGLVVVVSHLADISVVVWIGWLACSLGVAVASRIARCSSTLRSAIGLTIGLVAIATSVLGGAAIGVMGAVSLLVLPLAGLTVIATGWVDQATTLLGHARRDLQMTFHNLPVAVLGIGPIMIIATLTALQPIADWDSLMYHLLVPSEWLEAGRLLTPDGNHHVAFIGAVQLLYAPLDVFDVKAGPSLLQAMALLATFALVSDGAQRYGGQLAGVFGGALIAGSSALLLVSVIPRIDMWVTLVIAIVHILVIDAVLQREIDGQLIVWAGVMTGAGLAIKYQAVPYGLAAAIAVVLAASVRRRPAIARALLVGSVLGLAVAAPWMIKNIILLGDPIHPFLRGHTTWPWLASLNGEYQIVGQFAPLSETRQPFTPIDWVLAPTKLFMQSEGNLGGLHPLMVLAPLGLLVPSNRRASLFAIFQALVGVGIVISVSDTTNLRYLNPAFPGLAIGTAIGLGFLVSHVDPKRARIFVSAIVLTTLAMSFIWAGRRVVGDGLGYALGVESQEEWESPPLKQTGAVLRQVDDWLLEVGAQRTLLLLEPRSAFFESEVIQDILLTNWPHMWAALKGSCPVPGVFSHILLNHQNYEFFVFRGMDPVANNWHEFEEFADKCLLLVGERGRFSLYKLR